MTSTQEIESLRATKQATQTALDREKERYLHDITACKSELVEIKTLYKKTKDELGTDKANLKKAVCIWYSVLYPLCGACVPSAVYNHAAIHSSLLFCYSSTQFNFFFLFFVIFFVLCSVVSLFG
jgi:hypothetical protein